MTVGLLTYNVEYAQRWPAIRDQIVAADVDIVCLQEVPRDGRGTAGSFGVAQVVSDIDWPHDYHQVENRRACDVGNLTLARGPVAHAAVLGAAPDRSYGLASLVEIGTVRLTLVNVHLSPVRKPLPLSFVLSELTRWREVKHLTGYIESVASTTDGFESANSATGPVVAAGDFNTFWPAPGYTAMRRSWRDSREQVGGRGATRPTAGLPFVIDHVFLRGQLRAVEYEILPAGGSDHRGVVVRLEAGAA